MSLRSLILALSFSPFLLCSAPLKVQVNASSAVLIDADTGEVLYEKKAHQKAFPASTTKIATALYALVVKRNDLSSVVTASADAVSAVSPKVKRAKLSKHPPHRLEFGGTHMGLKVGEQLTLNDLLYGLMLPSGNDAANVIAEHVSGSVPKFIDELNGFLHKIGCRNTRFYAPHGLPHPEHVTTAYDLALMTRYAMKIPKFREIVRSSSYTRPQTNMQEESILQQFNALLRPGKHFYKHAIGVKTGYTESAGFNIVAAADNGERNLIAVVLGGKERQQRYLDAIALFESAFKEQKMRRTLFSHEYDVFTLKTHEAKAAIKGYLNEDVTIDYYPSQEPRFKTFVHWDKVELPIAAGSKIGEVHVISHDKRLLKNEPIFAKEDVEATFAHSFSKRVDWIFSFLPLSKPFFFGLILCGGLFISLLRMEKRSKR